VTEELPTLHGERLTLRPAVLEDAEALAQVLAEPEVAAWWPGYDLARVREELPEGHAIVVAGAVRGWLIVTEENEPDYRHAALDVVLATELHGRGYGTEALRLAIRHFRDARGHHRFTIDPAAANARAIRAYAAVGFEPVGVMRRYERGPDGAWRDGLLMDLLADELVCARRQPPPGCTSPLS
jgi:aminoglycoside 6'-N-acetyltransferase